MLPVLNYIVYMSYLSEVNVLIEEQRVGSNLGTCELSCNVTVRDIAQWQKCPSYA